MRKNIQLLPSITTLMEEDAQVPLLVYIPRQLRRQLKVAAAKLDQSVRHFVAHRLAEAIAATKGAADGDTE